MEYLSGSERNLLILGFCADKTKKITFKQFLKTAIILLTFTVTGLYPTGGYVLTNSDDIFGSIFSGMVFMSISSTCVSIITVTWNRRKVRDIIDAIRQVTAKGIHFHIYIFFIKTIFSLRKFGISIVSKQRKFRKL